jgi:hypothetical protein
MIQLRLAWLHMHETYLCMEDCRCTVHVHARVLSHFPWRPSQIFLTKSWKIDGHKTSITCAPFEHIKKIVDSISKPSDRNQAFSASIFCWIILESSFVDGVQRVSYGYSSKHYMLFSVDKQVKFSLCDSSNRFRNSWEIEILSLFCLTAVECGIEPTSDFYS